MGIRDRFGLAHIIASAMRRHMAGLGDALILPVPLHRRRLWRRGFNQAALIAQALAGRVKDRLRFESLGRRKPPPRPLHTSDAVVDLNSSDL